MALFLIYSVQNFMIFIKCKKEEKKVNKSNKSVSFNRNQPLGQKSPEETPIQMKSVTLD